MKHIAQIATEFLKISTEGWWDKLTHAQQENYLQLHPGTDKRVTAKPSFGSKLKEFVNGEKPAHKSQYHLYNDIANRLGDDSEEQAQFIKQISPKDRERYKKDHKRIQDRAHAVFQDKAWKDLRTVGYSPKHAQDVIDNAYYAHGDNDIDGAQNHVDKALMRAVDVRKKNGTW